MLQITIPAIEVFDEIKGEFISSEETKLQLEHSLVSLSKWESKWCKSFLSRREKTYEETLDYIKCMTLNPEVDERVYSCLTMENIKEINAYIEAPMTATHFFNADSGSGGRETITSEVIYNWMITLGIPFECQEWHLNRLLTLVKVCSIKNNPKQKKMSKGDIMRQNTALNAARRQQLNTKG